MSSECDVNALLAAVASDDADERLMEKLVQYINSVKKRRLMQKILDKGIIKTVLDIAARHTSPPMQVLALEVLQTISSKVNKGKTEVKVVATLMPMLNDGHTIDYVKIEVLELFIILLAKYRSLSVFHTLGLPYHLKDLVTPTLGYNLRYLCFDTMTSIFRNSSKYWFRHAEDCFIPIIMELMNTPQLKMITYCMCFLNFLICRHKKSMAKVIVKVGLAQKMLDMLYTNKLVFLQKALYITTCIIRTGDFKAKYMLDHGLLEHIRVFYGSQKLKSECLSVICAICDGPPSHAIAVFDYGLINIPLEFMHHRNPIDIQAESASVIISILDALPRSRILQLITNFVMTVYSHEMKMTQSKYIRLMLLKALWKALSRITVLHKHVVANVFENSGTLLGLQNIIIFDGSEISNIAERIYQEYRGLLISTAA